MDVYYEKVETHFSEVIVECSINIKMLACENRAGNITVLLTSS